MVVRSLVTLSTEYVAVATYVTCIYISALWPLAIGFRFVTAGYKDSIGWTLLCSYVTAAVVPLQWTEGLLRPFIRFSSERAADYFSVRVVAEGEGLRKNGKGCLIGFEPHSSLPLALPVAFNTYSSLLPKELFGETHGVASSICFHVPIVRQLWHGLGLRPVHRRSVSHLLASGKAVVLVPGGVQEVLLMEHRRETVFLKSRLGFVRLAMKHGVPVVPAFVFGQTATYSWYRPGPPLFPKALVESMSRTFGAVPITMYGVFGTPMPHRVPMTVVLGKPIEVPHMADPSDDDVRKYLDQFIAAVQGLYERHKDKCGHKDIPLVVL